MGALLADPALAGDEAPGRVGGHLDVPVGYGRHPGGGVGVAAVDGGPGSGERAGSVRPSLSGVRQPSISQFLSGRGHLSDEQLDRLLSCMGYRLEVVRRRVRPELTRSEWRSWRLHRQLSTHLTRASLERWRSTVERNLERLRSTVRGQPHVRNLDRWESLLDHGDVPGLHRVLTGHGYSFGRPRSSQGTQHGRNIALYTVCAAASRSNRSERLGHASVIITLTDYTSWRATRSAPPPASPCSARSRRIKSPIEDPSAVLPAACLRDRLRSATDHAEKLVLAAWQVVC